MVASRVPFGGGASRLYLPVRSPLASGKNGSSPIRYASIAGTSSRSMSRTTRLYSSWHEAKALRFLVSAVHCASTTCQAARFEQPM